MAFGEVFVGAVCQVLLEMLASGVIARFQKYVEGKKIDPTTIKNFEKNLRMIAALLNDAQEQRIEGATFKIWVEELQDLAYDLDDVLDELVTDAQLQLQQQHEDDDDSASTATNITCLQSAKTKVKSIIACGSRVAQRFHYSGGDLSSKIQDINNRLEQIQQQGQQNLGLLITGQGQNLGLKEGTRQIPGREITSLTNEPVLLGRDEKKREVINELLKEDSTDGNYVVIPIVGKGGIGKTTLAQFVYNDQQLKDHFDIKAWVSVSDVFDVTCITTNIINSSYNTSLKFNNLDHAQNELIEGIRNKKFLFVLDDVWNDAYDLWRELQKPFQSCAMGSKVIVTTRDRKIATMVRTNSTHHIINLEGLLDEDCWRLFQHHANEDSNNDLVEMKDDIINKCKGLPLAAKALGGLFRKTTKKSQCWMILNNNIWSEEGKVLPILRLSYYHLPPHLKHTFAFCCTLPKDYEFEEMEVILLWMAQGFLIRGKEERCEDIGHLYFHDLVSRSLFERSPSKKNCYIMHDLVHDLAQWAASDICCCIMNVKDMQREVERTRHLYITPSVINHSLWSNVEPIAAKLRTFICPTKEHINGSNMEFPEFLRRFRCVRTLILASETVEVLPECVGDLTHLRFLDLRFTEIQVLPDSIRKLCNLQVLFLGGCYNLIEVRNIGFLVKLRHLEFQQSLWEAMPRGVGNLTNLQSLGKGIYLGVDCGNGSMIRELRRLNHLHGELNIYGMENVRKVDDAWEAQLHEKKGVSKVYLKWGGNRHEIDEQKEREVLEELRPATCLEKLKLEGYGGMTWPGWLGDGSLKNMVAIELTRCVNCESLPQLVHLPLLKKLVIHGMNGVREVSGPSSLEEFHVRRCNSLITVNEIPISVVTLEIDNCPNLRKVEFKNSSLATPSAPSKVSIRLEECSSLVTVGRIPLSVESLIVSYCNIVKLLFGDMTLEAVEGTEKEVSRQTELAHLLHLQISGCFNFRRLPEDLLLPSVKSIVFRNNELQEALPEQLHTFTSLEELRIINCPNIKRFPKEGLPKTMKSIRVESKTIEESPIGSWGIHLLPHLHQLYIENIGSSTDMIECIPDPHLSLPSSLSCLQISGLKNLKSINCASFPNLTQLEMSSCPKLENLVDYSRPPNLKSVLINDCPMIKQQCQPDPNGLILYNCNDKQRYSLYKRVETASSGTSSVTAII